MRHYLDNSGNDLSVSPEKMLKDLPGFREQVEKSLQYQLVEQINERITDEYNGQPMRFQITTDWQGYYAQKSESEDWFYAMGGFSFAHGADVIVVPSEDGKPIIHVEYQTHVFDRYNWDADKGVRIVGVVSVPDESLGHLHQVGIAQEYEVWGKSRPKEFSYQYQGKISKPDYQYDDDKTRRDNRRVESRRDDPTRNPDRSR